MTKAERKEVKAGKHERIRELLKTMPAKQPKPVVEDQLTMGEVVRSEDEDLTTHTHNMKRG